MALPCACLFILSLAAAAAGRCDAHLVGVGAAARAAACAANCAAGAAVAAGAAGAAAVAAVAPVAPVAAGAGADIIGAGDGCVPAASTFTRFLTSGTSMSLRAPSFGVVSST